MLYQVKQTRKKKYFFNLLEKELTSSYSFNTYNKALIFCLSEGIKQFSCIISDVIIVNDFGYSVTTSKETTRKTYENSLYT